MSRFRLFVILCVGLLALAPLHAQDRPAFRFEKGDRVAWIGSSSTRIGVWPKTMEFLLRTRHPELNLTFQKFTTGGGTFATGLKHLDAWLAEFRPTVVFFNYGGNDANAGDKGLLRFKENLAQCVAKARAAGARVVLLPPQAADVRKSGKEPAARREKYAETLLAFARAKSWPAVDTHHPLAKLQQGGQTDDEKYTILSDKIHLTTPAYVAWGFFLYDGLDLPGGTSAASLRADGSVTQATNCKLTDVRAGDDGLSFTWADAVLPILPPGPLPPRKYVPLEECSPYLLQVTGLPRPGTYEVRCEGSPLGVASAEQLGRGVNLNTLLLDSGRAAPWAELAQELWAGKSQERVGQTRWRFEVKKQ